ncbi:MAG: hypothetical protein U0263_25280 [Polyangiaceae bacterium]
MATPGQDAKACIASTLDVRDGKVLWVRADEKNSRLLAGRSPVAC